MITSARAAHAALVGVLLPLLLATTVAAQPPPPALTGPVNDFASVVDEASRTALDKVIRSLEAASGDVIVVATVKTVAEWGDIRAYATKMFENGGRGIGQKGRDNGLLVLLAVDDRRVWVEVGYDLEGIVTDGYAGEISRNVMTPRFRAGQYGAGLVDGVATLAQRVAQARNVTLEGVPAPARTRRRQTGSAHTIITLFILALILLNLFGGIGRPRGRRRWSSRVGPFGAGYGGWTMGGGGGWSGGGGFGGGFGGFGGGRSGGGGGGASW